MEQNQKLSRITYNAGRDQRVPLSVFFRHCETSFRKKFYPKGSPLQFFWVLRQTRYRKIPKGPPFQFFSALWDFSQKIFLWCRREYFETLMSFCYFWALDMAPAWAGPDLFKWFWPWYFPSQIWFKSEIFCRRMLFLNITTCKSVQPSVEYCGVCCFARSGFPNWSFL